MKKTRRVRIRCGKHSTLVGSYLDLFHYYIRFDMDVNAADTNEVHEAIYNLSRRLKDDFVLRTPNLKRLYEEYLKANDLVDGVGSRCEFVDYGKGFSIKYMRANYHHLETSTGYFTRDGAGEIDDEWSEETDFYFIDGKICYINQGEMKEWKNNFMYDMKCGKCGVNAECKRKCGIDKYSRVDICREYSDCEVEKSCRRCMAEFFGEVQ